MRPFVLVSYNFCKVAVDVSIPSDDDVSDLSGEECAVVSFIQQVMLYCVLKF